MTKANDEQIEGADQSDQAVDGPRDIPVTDVAEETPVPTDLQQQLEALTALAEENRNQHLRAVADLENYRRRSIREREELRQFAMSNLMEELLPILDNLGLGIASARTQTDSNAVADGVSMVLDQFKGVLDRNGLIEIDPKAGDAFDPHKHESMAHQPSDEIPIEAISEVIRVGYSLNGRLLRAASVVLSSGPAKPGSASE